MKKKIILLITIIFISFTSIGCWNYHELSDLAIITGIGIDKENDKYKISMLIANTTDSNSSDSVSSKTTIITGIGNNITEAADDIKAKSSKDIYIGHISLLLVSEEVAKDNMYDVIDPIFRNPESIKKLNLVIIKNTTANKVLNILSPLDIYPSQNIISNINNSLNTMGISYNTYVSDYIYKLINYGIDNIVPSISVVGDKKIENSTDQLKEVEIEQYIKVDDLGLFKDTKLIDYADTMESKIINILSNNSTSLSFTTRCYNDLDKYIVFKINDPKTKIDLSIKDNKIKYTFNIKAYSSINETNCKLNLTDEKVIKKITDYTKSELYENIEKTLNKVKHIKTDIFGLGNMIYKKDYKYWYKIKDNWEDIYSNIDYDIKIDLTLNKLGALETTIKEEDK